MAKFLVVDDEPDVLFLIQANIRALGHAVVTAQTIDIARERCEQEAPDVLLLDVSMPEMDGPTFLGVLREAGLEPPHVYLLSAIPPDQLDQWADNLGVKAISKPFTAPSLRASLAEVLDG